MYKHKTISSNYESLQQGCQAQNPSWANFPFSYHLEGQHRFIPH